MLRDAPTSAWVAFVLVCTVWGSTYFAIRLGVEAAPPFLFAAMRFGIAGVVLGAWAWWRGYRPPRDPAEWGVIAVTGALLLMGGNGLVSWAEQYVASGEASVLVAVSPMVTTAIDAAIPGSTLVVSPAMLAGFAIGLAGTLLLVGATPAALLAADLRGPSALLGATLCWGLGSVILQRHRPHSASPVVATIQMLVAAVGLLLIALTRGEPALFVPTEAVVAPLAYLVVAGSLIGFTAYGHALRHLPAPLVGTYAYVNPVVAVLLGWGLGGEKVTPRMLGAMGIILGAVAFIQLAARRTPAPAK